jgi:phosphonate transport system substrate-binding protein
MRRHRRPLDGRASEVSGAFATGRNAAYDNVAMEERFLKYLRLTAVLTAIVLFVVACGGGGTASPDETADATESQAAEAPDELVIGFVPSREADALVETIQPVADYLSEQLGMPVSGVVTTDYTGLVTAMESEQAHIGAFGPFSLLQARDRAGAEIILQSERFGSATYHTQFMTNDPDKYCEDEPVEIEDGWLNCNGTADADTGPVGVEALANLEEGTTFSFVEQASASGYIFPATILSAQGIDYETGIEPIFAGGHDSSVIAVCEGDAEVGVAFDDARDAAETDCDVANNVVVFAYGPEIPNDGWAVLGSLPDDLKEDIKQALLDYAGTEEGQATLESIYEITGLVEADQESFTIVEEAAAELGVEGD